MTMTQAAFSRHLGVSKKTVSLMKNKRQIVMNDKFVNVEKSMDLLKSIGKTFDANNKMITSNTAPGPAKEESEKNLLNTDFFYPTLTDEEKIVKEKHEVEALKKQAEKEGLSVDKVLTDEIDSLEPIEVNKIKIFWQGQLERVKYEKEMGELVSKDEVYEEHFKVARTVRDAFLGLSNRVAHKLLNKTEVFEITSTLDEEVQKILENLSR